MTVELSVDDERERDSWSDLVILYFPKEVSDMTSGRDVHTFHFQISWLLWNVSWRMCWSWIVFFWITERKLYHTDKTIEELTDLCYYVTSSPRHCPVIFLEFLVTRWSDRLDDDSLDRHQDFYRHVLEIKKKCSIVTVDIDMIRLDIDLFRRIYLRVIPNLFWSFCRVFEGRINSDDQKLW